MKPKRATRGPPRDPNLYVELSSSSSDEKDTDQDYDPSDDGSEGGAMETEATRPSGDSRATSSCDKKSSPPPSVRVSLRRACQKPLARQPDKTISETRRLRLKKEATSGEESEGDDMDAQAADHSGDRVATPSGNKKNCPPPSISSLRRSCRKRTYVEESEGEDLEAEETDSGNRVATRSPAKMGPPPPSGRALRRSCQKRPLSRKPNNISKTFKRLRLKREASSGEESQGEAVEAEANDHSGDHTRNKENRPPTRRTPRRACRKRTYVEESEGDDVEAEATDHCGSRVANRSRVKKSRPPPSRRIPGRACRKRSLTRKRNKTVKMTRPPPGRTRRRAAQKRPPSKKPKKTVTKANRLPIKQMRPPAATPQPTRPRSKFDEIFAYCSEMVETAERNIIQLKNNVAMVETDQAYIWRELENGGPRRDDQPMDHEDDDIQVVEEDDDVQEVVVVEEMDEEEGEDAGGEAVDGRVVKGPGQDYVLLRKLGSGGFGSVHLVKDSFHIESALKMTKVDVLNDEMVKGERAFHEAMRTTEGCRYILASFGMFETVFEEERFRCERMELCKIDLYEALEEGFCFESREVERVIGQTCSAVAFLNRLQFIHTDIKADNVMMSHYEEVEQNGQKYARNIQIKLIDFNSIYKKSEEGPEWFRGQALGYRSPEMALGMPCDEKIDVWSLGVVAMQIAHDRFFIINDHEGVADDDGMREWILGEIEALVGRIPVEMRKQSELAHFRKATFFPRLVPANLRFNLTLTEALESLGADLARILKKMLTVDVGSRPKAIDIAQELGYM